MNHELRFWLENLSNFLNEQLVEKVQDEHNESKVTNAKKSKATKHKEKHATNVLIKGV